MKVMHKLQKHNNNVKNPSLTGTRGIIMTNKLHDSGAAACKNRSWPIDLLHKPD